MAPNPFRVPSAITHLIPGLPKLNPGLEFANTFGVKIFRCKNLVVKQEVVGLLHRERTETNHSSVGFRFSQLLAAAFYLVTQPNDCVEIPRRFVGQRRVEQFSVFKHWVTDKRFDQITKSRN